MLSSLDFSFLMFKIIEGKQLSSSEEDVLKGFIPYDNYAFTANKYPFLYSEKVKLLPVIYPDLVKLLKDLSLNNSDNLLETIWFFLLPLALQLANIYKQKSTPIVMGILGVQGTGKTTITKILALIWHYLNLSSVAISLDDLYKTYEDRQELLKSDARLIWRGPPGTHDVQLGIDVLTALKNRTYPVSIPRFDKSLYNGRGDRTLGDMVNKADIIMFEGWFVGVQPVPQEVFNHLCEGMITGSDAIFAMDCNERLREYLPLWEMLDYLMILNPEDYRYSLKWRQEAEEKMIAGGKKGMTNQEIQEFVNYFWKALPPEIFIKPLTQNRELADLVVNININHQINNIVS